ncbi:LodA/GoxA family CTQ-dependent oxidase [Poseidonocella sedimentorum]|uniref:L-lysine 6-oxidase n=1 Tax=Poseidonocella sedimentorum TaxID=871652 RepID=A0A1I6ELX8_9RHOB|nr:LodA/GoxA family CTQ-dependent oxidase [Poseidonocella sedimentorum]SFR18647.1 hypothetical protein SAMN04515673_11453 [Poseidonocella sedimentorum]
MASEIKSIRVHPGIGIARVGNSGAGSPDPLEINQNFYVGPEAPGIVVDPGNPNSPASGDGPGPNGGTYRDGNMDLKRQAQRFRIYGQDSDGDTVEITRRTPGVKDITWRVHVQNMKAANFAFQGAYLFDATQMRNPNIQPREISDYADPANRSQLIVDPGAQELSLSSGTEEISLRGSCFFDSDPTVRKYYLPADLKFGDAVTPQDGWVEVTYSKAENIELGRIQLDEDGRLLFIAGPGLAGCVTTPHICLSNPSETHTPPNGTPVTNGTLPNGDTVDPKDYDPLVNQFAYFNVPGWWDDTCGGEIDATVTFEDASKAPLTTRPGGIRDPKAGGWIVTAPPKFAPDMYHVVSIKDRVYEAFPEQDPTLASPALSPADPIRQAPVPGVTKFWRDVYPTLARAVNYGWVSAEAGGVTPENRNLAHGPKQAGNMLSDDNIARFVDNTKDKSSAAYQTRQQIFRIMRQAEHGARDAHYPAPTTEMEGLVSTFPRLIMTLPTDPPPTSAPLPDELKANRSARGNKMPKLWGTAGKPLQNQQLGHDFPNQYLSLTANTLAHLYNWAFGEFENERAGTSPPVPPPLDQIPIEDQPHAMDCAALEPTIGGGFHPGIEFPYVICYRSYFEEAFRVAGGTVPGAVAAFMSSPWQGDYWSCNVAWWPVQRPDIVFQYYPASYESPTPIGGVVNYEGGQRTYREWFRGFDTEGNPLSGSDGYNQMVYAWDKLGMVLPQRDSDGNVITVRNAVAFREYERNPVLNSVPASSAGPACDPDDNEA